MDESQRRKLLREAAEDPARLLTQESLWRLELWPHYLHRYDELLFDDPREALDYAERLPRLAAHIANAEPGANGADLMLLGHTYRGSALRATGSLGRAGAAFQEARFYTGNASPKALAEYLRRLAYLRIIQHDPECFVLVGEAIALEKQGDLVDRHGLGTSLLCRGCAYVEFGRHGKSFDDWSAALCHLSIKLSDRLWYGAVHNLTTWAVDYGTDEQLKSALGNLKEAQAVLNTYRGRRFAKLKLRWLIAVIHARLGHHGYAEVAYLEARRGLVKLELGYEVGMLQIDLAMLYLAQGRLAELEPLVAETAALLRQLGVPAKAAAALDGWRRAEAVDEALLKQVRNLFAAEARPLPAMAA